MFNTLTSRAAAGTSILAVLAVALGIGLAQGQVESRADDSASPEKIRIGTYENDRVVQGFHKTQEFVAHYQELERRFMAAQEANDMDALMEVQMEAQNLPLMEQELMIAFNDAIDRVVPEIAQDRNLTAIALELIYSGDSVEPEDITDAVIEAINEGAEVPTLEPEVEEPQPDEDDDDQE